LFDLTFRRSQLQPQHGRTPADGFGHATQNGHLHTFNVNFHACNMRITNNIINRQHIDWPDIGWPVTRARSKFRHA
jgi:hypothetical protein